MITLQHNLRRGALGLSRRCPTHSGAISTRRSLATASDRFVKIVEVSPRDGLQNEKALVPTPVKLELIRRLQDAGLSVIEAGAFVSPKWVPQMADASSILQSLSPKPGVSYPFLVPNERGLETLLSLLPSPTPAPPPTDEIAIFTAASDAFCQANTNCTMADSLTRLERVARRALDAGLRVRGYVSVVAGCPYSGAVDPLRVAEASAALVDMGCYEVSLGDTVGVGTPSSLLHVLDACVQCGIDPTKLAAHCHDTFGTGLANVLALVSAGVRTVDTSVGGLGGCPYSPGATGNIDTESVVYALHGQGYQTGVDLEAVAEVGEWISGQLGRANGSRAGRALSARRKAKEHKARL